MAKNDRLYKLEQRHVWRKRTCHVCDRELIKGDVIFTKARAQGAKHYCGSCAESVGLISEYELKKTERVVLRN